MSGFTSGLHTVTGTGWPPHEDVEYDRTLYARGGAAVALADDPRATKVWNELLDRRSWPFSTEDRAELRHFLGSRALLPGVDNQVIWSLVHRLEERDARKQASRRTCLYRFLDDAGRLLYVGVTYNPDEREQQHRASQRWAPLIAEREDEWLDSREEALRAEAEAIRDESPLFNEAGRPRLPAMPRETA